MQSTPPLIDPPPESNENDVTIRLHRSEVLIACVLVTAILVFYCGPLAFQAILNRRPPASLVQGIATGELPQSLREQDIYQVISVKSTFTRTAQTNWSESIFASGRWQANAQVLLRTRPEIFEASDLEAKARIDGDNPDKYAKAKTIASRFSSKVSLPAVPPPILLYERVPASEQRVTVRFGVEHQDSGWKGLSPSAGLAAWGQLFSDSRGWTPAPSIRASVEGIAATKVKYFSSPGLPRGALVVGDPGTSEAIQGYVKARRAFTDAVFRELPAQNEAQFDRLARQAVVENAKLKVNSPDFWSIASIDLSPGPISEPAKDQFDITAAVTFSATDNIVVTATPADISEVGSQDDATGFDNALRDDTTYLMGAIKAPPQLRLLKVAVSNGTRCVDTATIHVITKDGYWDVDRITWNSEDPFSVGHLAEPLDRVTQSDIMIGARGNKARLDAYLATRARFVADVEAKIQQLVAKWGSDRSTWQAKRVVEAKERAQAITTIKRAIEAVGGRDTLQQFTGYRAIYKVRGEYKGTGYVARLVEYFAPPDNIRIDQEVYKTQEDLSRIEGDATAYPANAALPHRTILCSNGTLSWQITDTLKDPLPQVLSDTRVDYLRSMAFRSRCVSLLPLLTSQYDIRQVPIDPIEAPAGSIAVSVSRSGYPDTVLYFDEATGLPAGIDWSYADSSQHFATIRERYENYQDIAGQKVPTVCHEVDGDETDGTSELEDYRSLAASEFSVFDWANGLGKSEANTDVYRESFDRQILEIAQRTISPSELVPIHSKGWKCSTPTNAIFRQLTSALRQNDWKFRAETEPCLGEILIELRPPGFGGGLYHTFVAVYSISPNSCGLRAGVIADVLIAPYDNPVQVRRAAQFGANEVLQKISALVSETMSSPSQPN